MSVAVIDADDLRAIIRDEVRAALEPMREAVAALREASPPALVDIPEAARRLGVCAATIRRRIKANELPFTKVGKRVKIDLAAIRPPSDEAGEF
jgi:excisionase family DNA binding protein